MSVEDKITIIPELQKLTLDFIIAELIEADSKKEESDIFEQLEIERIYGR